jgi:glutaminase
MSNNRNNNVFSAASKTVRKERTYLTERAITKLATELRDTHYQQAQDTNARVNIANYTISDFLDAAEFLYLREHSDATYAIYVQQCKAAYQTLMLARDANKLARNTQLSNELYKSRQELRIALSAMQFEHSRLS